MTVLCRYGGGSVSQEIQHVLTLQCLWQSQHGPLGENVNAGMIGPNSALSCLFFFF